MPEAFGGQETTRPFKDGLYGHPDFFPYVLDPKDDLTPKESLELTMRIATSLWSNKREGQFTGITVNQTFMDDLPAHLVRHFSLREGASNDTA